MMPLLSITDITEVLERLWIVMTFMICHLFSVFPWRTLLEVLLLLLRALVQLLRPQDDAQSVWVSIR